MEFIFNDGGRRNYFKGNAGDCVVRAIAITEKKDYKKVYESFKNMQYFGEDQHTPRSGASERKTRRILEDLGYIYIKTSSLEISEATFEGLTSYIAEYENHLRAFSHGVALDTHSTEYELTGIYTKGNSVVKARALIDMIEHRDVFNEVGDGYKWEDGYLILTDREKSCVDCGFW